MVGGTTPPQSDSREISRVLVLNLSGKASGAHAPPRRGLSLTTPSLLSRAPLEGDRRSQTFFDEIGSLCWALARIECVSKPAELTVYAGPGVPLPYPLASRCVGVPQSPFQGSKPDSRTECARSASLRAVTPPACGTRRGAQTHQSRIAR